MTFGKLRSEANFLETHSTAHCGLFFTHRCTGGAEDELWPVIFLVFVLLIDVFSVDSLSALPECPVTTRPVQNHAFFVWPP